MPFPGRDPLSVRMDPVARQILLAAIRRHRGGGGWLRFWVPSPARELRDLDPGGLTRHERALRRALYYPVVQVPRRMGTPQVWSLRTEVIDGFVNRGGRWGRYHRARLYVYGARGYSSAERRRGPGYTRDPSKRSYVGPDGSRVIPRAS